MKRFDSISQVFNLLNDCGANYLVLRNYENMLNPELFVGNHADIDLLCEDSQKIVKILDAQTTRKNVGELRGDGVHYFLMIAGNRVSFDLRQVGDGYYCDDWETDLLRKRRRQDCFYVMDDENYFYTLVYHAILQKRQLSDDYRTKLIEMAAANRIPMKRSDEEGFIFVLQEFMKSKNYRFVYSKDKMVPNRFHLVDSTLVDTNYSRWLKHRLFETKVAIIEGLVKVKHALSL